MKVEQNVEFHPITITLTSRVEAETLHNTIEELEEHYTTYGMRSDERKVLIDLSNMLGECVY